MEYKMNEKIVVVIATYNGEKYIVEQLESIANQSCLPDEVLIFDDCSSDSTIDVIKNYLKNNKTFERICSLNINKNNKGYAKNFIEGALQVENGIIFFCDQDDIWEKDKIKEMSNIMKTNSEINLLCSNLQPFYFEKNTRKWDKKILREMKETGVVEKVVLNDNNFHLKRSGCTMCVKASFLKDVYKYWINKWAHDDFVWKMAIFSDSCAIYQKTTLKRRMHENNATVIRERTRQKRIEQLNLLNLQCEKLKVLVKDKSLSEDKMKIIEKNNIAIKKRLDLIKNKKLYIWFDLFLNYKNCYPRRKGLYFDLYISFFNRYKGV